ncbi:MAG: nucleoside kinase [Candidatus Azobacteroides sp.]|nr:nucleoside kinase [Candidatus Azobacteroides sp.]
MDDTIKIYCKNNSRYQEVPVGISLWKVYQKMDIQLSSQPACVKVNNKTESLLYRCYKPKDIEFIGVSDPSGMRTYVRSLCCILTKAVHDLFPNGRLYIEHALSKGYYCEMEIGRRITEEDVIFIKERMQEIVKANMPFESHEEQTPIVTDLFRKNNREDKARLLETVKEVYSKYVSLDGYIDDFYGCLLPSTSWVYLFDIVKYYDGLLLRIPNVDSPNDLQPYVKQTKMMSVFQEFRQYQKAIDMNNVGELNKGIHEGEMSTVVKVAEILQERKIGKIADEINKRFNEGVRVVLISGPSSSGKTTFCKRLQIQLLANALHPIGISLDDYYVNRELTPLDESGEYDYESLYAIDLELFNEDLRKMLAGEIVALPTYDFLTGKRVYKGNKVSLQQNNILVMEGIHAMNPILTSGISPEAIYKIYVSALTSIPLDNHNWIPTTDNRLIRRIVRDYQFRGYSAKETIARWPSVRKGEDKWIFPFQEDADDTFNSAMLYELAALRKMADPILKEVTQMDNEFSEAHRLLKFLRYFNYIDESELPNTSLLREFVGGSSFQY